MYAPSSQIRYQPADFSGKTVKFIRKYVSNTFKVPFHLIPRIFFHGLILSCIIAGFWLLDSLKDPILGSTVGMEYQPIAKLFSVLTVLGVVCIYDFLTSVVSKPSLFHIVSAVFGLSIMILSALLSNEKIGLVNTEKSPYRLIGWVAYLTIEAYGSLMVTLFWSFTNSIMDLDQAKGAYGLIIALAQFGAIFGSTLATNSSTIGIPTLFIIASILIFSVSLLIKAYHITYRDYTTESLKSRVRSENEESMFAPLLPEAIPFIQHSSQPSTTVEKSELIQDDDEMETESQMNEAKHSSLRKESVVYPIFVQAVKVLHNFYDGLSLIIKYPYVLKLLGVSCLYEIVVVILDYEFKLMGSIHSLSGDLNDKVAHGNRFANLLGHFGQLTNFLGFLLSVVGFSYLVHNIGVQYCLMIFPTVLFVAVIISYLVPSLWILFVFVSILKAMIFSLHDPVKELLYIPTSESIKFKAKAWIDVFGSRLAKAAGSFITSLALGDWHRLREIGEIPALVLSILVIIVTWSIGNDFKEQVASNKVVGDEIAQLKYDAIQDGPIVNGLKPGEVGYSGYDPELFNGIFDDVDLGQNGIEMIEHSEVVVDAEHRKVSWEPLNSADSNSK